MIASACEEPRDQRVQRQTTNDSCEGICSSRVITGLSEEGHRKHKTGEAHDLRQVPQGSQNHRKTRAVDTMKQAGSGTEKAGRERG